MGDSPDIHARLPATLPASAGPRNISQAYDQRPGKEGAGSRCSLRPTRSISLRSLLAVEAPAERFGRWHKLRRYSTNFNTPNRSG